MTKSNRPGSLPRERAKGRGVRGGRVLSLPASPLVRELSSCSLFPFLFQPLPTRFLCPMPSRKPRWEAMQHDAQIQASSCPSPASAPRGAEARRPCRKQLLGHQRPPPCSPGTLLKGPRTYSAPDRRGPRSNASVNFPLSQSAGHVASFPKPNDKRVKKRSIPSAACRKHPHPESQGWELGFVGISATYSLHGFSKWHLRICIPF